MESTDLEWKIVHQHLPFLGGEELGLFSFLRKWMTYSDMHRKVMFANHHSSYVQRYGCKGSMSKIGSFARSWMKDADMCTKVMFTTPTSYVDGVRVNLLRTFCWELYKMFTTVQKSHFCQPFIPSSGKEFGVNLIASLLVFNELFRSLQKSHFAGPHPSWGCRLG